MGLSASAAHWLADAPAGKAALEVPLAAQVVKLLHFPAAAEWSAWRSKSSLIS